MSVASELSPVRTKPNTAAGLQRGLLWLIGASSAIVLIEPSPFEMAVPAAMVAFIAANVTISRGVLPLVFMLCLLNAGYAFGATGLYDDSRVALWVASSCFLAIAAIFVALAMADDTVARLSALSSGFVAGGVVAALTGLAGYFHLLGSASDLFTLYGRMKGTFKDPNVLGTFLLFPALVSLHRLVTAPLREAPWQALLLGVLGIGILLSFSRASWGVMAAGGMLLLAGLFAYSQSPAEKLRILLLAAAAVAVLGIGIAALLSVDQVADLFQQRARLDQDYDGGRVGRFGRHLLGADLALSEPFGIGPLQFSRFFPEDPHNSYLNAFMSGGWLSGTVYVALVVTTLGAAWRAVRLHARSMPAVLPVTIATACIAVQSFIVDTDHWRHYFVLIGLCWGLASLAPTRHSASA